MKKLTILIAMLMASNAWSEIVNLACESSEYLSITKGQVFDKATISLTVDTKKKVVTVMSREVKYTEKGNKIRFKVTWDTFNYRWSFGLDRLTGVLDESHSYRMDPNKPGEIQTRDYQCTAAKKLF